MQSKTTCLRIYQQACCLLLLLALVGCLPPSDRQIEITGGTMGTTYSIKIVSPEVSVSDLKPAIDIRLSELNSIFSTYDSESELSQLNRHNFEQNGPAQVSSELIELLEVSQQLHQLSRGAFDVTVGPLVNLWGFGPDGPRSGVPSDESIIDALEITGLQKVSWSDGAVSKPNSVYIDLSAIAKGYAVDEIGSLLEAEGEGRYMVEIGGEVRARGLNSIGHVWRIAIEVPDRTARKIQKAIPLDNQAMASSGDYRNYFQHEGQYYSHTIDPVTGWPVTHQMASITVLHPSASYADGIATAFSVLGPKRTLEIAEARKLKILAIMRESTPGEMANSYKEVYSTELEKYLDLQ